MRPDFYTRIVLTVIALCLVLIACNQYVHPAIAAGAQDLFAGVQYVGHGEFYDSRSGEILVYGLSGSDAPGALLYKWKMPGPGVALTQEFDYYKSHPVK